MSINSTRPGGTVGGLTPTGQEVVTNKDIDGTTASNTSRITMPKASTATLTALTRKQGTLLHDTTVNTLLLDDGANLKNLSPVTTKGDIETYSTTATRLPVGTNGQVLTADSGAATGLLWSSIAGLGVATSTTSGTVTSFVPVILSAVKAVSSADYTVLTGDGYSTISVTTGASDRTITLPAASANAGREIVIKKVDAGAGFVVIDGNGSETIDGALTTQIHQQGSYISIYCDGTGWYVKSVCDYLKLEFNNTTITTSSASQAGIGIPGGVWTITGAVASVGGNGTTRAFDVTLSTTAGGIGSIGIDRFFLPFNNSYGGGCVEIAPARLTASTTSYYISIATLDSGSATSCYGYILAKRQG